MTKTQYTTRNEAVTGMSDDEFYGRESAIGVDLGACRRAALREARRAVDEIVMSSPEKGGLRLRRAVCRLAVAIGNGTEAEHHVYSADLPRLGNVISAEESRDRLELDRAVTRTHPHPELMAALRQIEEKLQGLG